MRSFGKTCRLAILMIAGASAGWKFLTPLLVAAKYGYDPGFGQFQKCAIPTTIYGALTGLGIEAVWRVMTQSNRPTTKPTPRWLWFKLRSAAAKKLTPRFSLLTLMLWITTTAFILALVFHLPSGQFALDQRNNRRRDIVVRVLVIAPLAAVEFAGLMIVARELRRARK